MFVAQRFRNRIASEGERCIERTPSFPANRCGFAKCRRTIRTFEQNAQRFNTLSIQCSRVYKLLTLQLSDRIAHSKLGKGNLSQQVKTLNPWKSLCGLINAAGHCPNRPQEREYSQEDVGSLAGAFDDASVTRLAITETGFCVVFRTAEHREAEESQEMRRPFDACERAGADPIPWNYRLRCKSGVNFRGVLGQVLSITTFTLVKALETHARLATPIKTTWTTRGDYVLADPVQPHLEAAIGIDRRLPLKDPASRLEVFLNACRAHCGSLLMRSPVQRKHCPTEAHPRAGRRH